MINLMNKVSPFVVGVFFLWMTTGCSKTSPPQERILAKAAASEVLPVKVLLAPTPPHATMTIPAWAQGKTISNVHVRPGGKIVALTFDDGPWPKYTRQILALMKQHNIKATFFMVGQELSRRPDVGREVVAAGHVIGNHSWNHPSRTRNAISQVKHTDSEIFKQLRIYTHLFRPPYGIVTNGMAAQAKNEKHAVMLWSVDSEDWRRPSASTIARTVMREVYSGGIILMHDGGGNRSHTVAALKIIIPALQKRGYKFVTVPELLAMRYVAPKKITASKNKKK
jgi:chitin deacetylase